MITTYDRGQELEFRRPARLGDHSSRELPALTYRLGMAATRMSVKGYAAIDLANQFGLPFEKDPDGSDACFEVPAHLVAAFSAARDAKYRVRRPVGQNGQSSPGCRGQINAD